MFIFANHYDRRPFPTRLERLSRQAVLPLEEVWWYSHVEGVLVGVTLSCADDSTRPLSDSTLITLWGGRKPSTHEIMSQLGLVRKMTLIPTSTR